MSFYCVCRVASIAWVAPSNGKQKHSSDAGKMEVVTVLSVELERSIRGLPMTRHVPQSLSPQTQKKLPVSLDLQK